MRWLRLVTALLLVLTAQAAAAREYSPGEHVRVLVIGQSYPAVVTRVYRDTVYMIRYDAGYGDYATLLEYIQPISGQRGTHYRPSVGEAVKVKVGQADYVAHVISTHDDDVYRVRYADGSEWDTPGDYMRPSGFYHAWSEGDRVQVLWKGFWYDASVLGVLDGDRYRVHYNGYGDNFDEEVPGERVRLERRDEADHPRTGITVTIAPRARATHTAPVSYTFLGMNTKSPVPEIRYRIEVNTPKPIEEVDIATKFLAADGSVVMDTTLVWQNIVKSKRVPIENGRSYEETSYLFPKTARVESRLLRVVFADGTRWEAAP